MGKGVRDPPHDVGAEMGEEEPSEECDDRGPPHPSSRPRPRERGE